MSFKTPRVLVVDDSAFMRRITCTLLVFLVLIFPTLCLLLQRVFPIFPFLGCYLGLVGLAWWQFRRAHRFQATRDAAAANRSVCA